MRIGQLLSFFRSAATYINADPHAVEKSGDFAERYSTYHRRIVWIAALSGVTGVVSGIVLLTQMGKHAPAENHPEMVFLLPVIYGVIGLLLGTGIACLFAPQAFLKSPIGLKWMRLIGTENILIARLVCFTLGVLLPAGFALMILFLPVKK